MITLVIKFCNMHKARKAHMTEIEYWHNLKGDK
jgi:hypothetical protein